MSSVTFPTNLGGNGQTYTDDDNPSTGLRDGGWRSRFVPCLEQTVAIADALTNRVIFGSDVSSSSLAVSTGSKTLTTSGSYNWAVGMFVTIARTSAPTANYMFGQVVSYNASTDQLVVSVSSVTGSGTYTDWTIAIAPPGLAPASFTGPTTIAVSSSSDALRITQTGSGNALVVEDSANPDSTPFVINNEGAMLLGATVANSKLYDPQTTTPRAPYVQFVGNNAVQAGQAIISWSSSTSAYYGPALYLAKSASNTINTQAVVTSGTTLGSVMFSGDDGTNFVGAAKIAAEVDGTPGTNDMPGRLIFSTTADGASSPTERMRIDSAGRVSVGNAAYAGINFTVSKNITGATTATSAIIEGITQSDVTSFSRGVGVQNKTAAASFTLANYYSFSARQGTFGAGSTVTNQIGFAAESTLTGATNNYGFYSSIASGSGRYNFYAAGTADNYFESRIGLGGAQSADGIAATIYNKRNITGNSFASAYYTNAAIQSDVTNGATYFETAVRTQAAAFTLSNLRHFAAAQGTFGAGSTITNQYGYSVDASLTGATNNYGFFSNIASGSGRYNFYAAGTAANYFAGNVGIGGDASVSLETFASATNWVRNNSAAGIPIFAAYKSNGTIASKTIVVSGDEVGRFDIRGYDGANFVQLAQIGGFVDGTPGTNDMPGRLVFSTTADGASSPTERMRIDNAGRVGIGGGASAGDNIRLQTPATGATTTNSIFAFQEIRSDVTAAANIFRSSAYTQTTTFNLPALRHFFASPSAFGAGSTVTDQFGFFAENTLTGATNNYGFYSNIASGSGRYNFYAAGTADNYFGGNVKTNGTLAGGYSALSAGATAMALASDKVVKVTPNATATFTTTVAPAGATASIIIVTSGTTSYTITFGTGFLTTGTLATGTVTAKTFVISFVSDGTTMIETSRTVAM